MPNSVALTRPNPQILDKIQTVVFSITGFLVKSLTNEDCLNSRTSNDTDMKLGPLSNLDKKITTSKKLTMTSCS